MRSLVVRLLEWHIRTYGMWAARHEPLSFAIYPLLAAAGPLIVWLTIGFVPAIWVFVFAEVSMAGFIYLGLRQRRRRRRAQGA